MATSVLGVWQEGMSLSAPPELANVVGIAAGRSHFVALTRDGRVVQWPEWSGGQVRQPDAIAALPPLQAVAAFDPDYGAFSLGLTVGGMVVGWGPGRSRLDVPAGLEGIVAIAGGGQHALALRRDGSVVAWGDDEHGQASVPDHVTGCSAVAAGDSHSLALCADGTVVAWGSNEAGQAKVPSYLTEVVSIAAGYRHSVALRSDGTVSIWGSTEASPKPWERR